MLKSFWLIYFAVLFSACASIDGREQAVLIESNPPGASIKVNGEDVGLTPQYVELSRQRHPSVDLETENEITTVELATHYRWRDSFFSNLILLYGAEVGWFLDFLTGAAWNISDSGVIEVGKVSPRGLVRFDPSEAITAAIAPPLADSPVLSDQAAKALQLELAKKSHERVQDYKVTLPTFLGFQYDFDGKVEELRRRDLYYALNVDKIYESTVDTKEGVFHLTAIEKDVITGETSQPIVVELEADHRIGSGLRFPSWLRRILPNDIGVDLLSDSVNVAVGNQTYTLNQTHDDQWWTNDLGYLSAINIANLPARRIGRPGRWQFTLVPSFRFSRKRYNTGNLPGDQGQTFVRWWIGGGYGAEVGYQFHRHYFYFDFIPNVFWDEVTWSQNQTDHSATGGGFSTTQELGYVYFVDSNWNLRFFTRTQQEDPAVWAQALQSAIPAFASAGVAVTVQAITYGLELAYRFDIGLQ